MLSYFPGSKNYLSNKIDRYEQHQNFVDDEKNIQFLSKLFIPLKKDYLIRSWILDADQTTSLAKMFIDAGYIMDVYDLIFPDDYFSNPMTLYLESFDMSLIRKSNI